MKKKITKKVKKETMTASEPVIELPPATGTDSEPEPAERTGCGEKACPCPKVQPLNLDLGREDLNLLVAKVNEIINAIN